MIRLIGIDVDGTLLDSEGRLPDENRDAIHGGINVERGRVDSSGPERHCF